VRVVPLPMGALAMRVVALRMGTALALCVVALPMGPGVRRERAA